MVITSGKYKPEPDNNKAIACNTYIACVGDNLNLTHQSQSRRIKSASRSEKLGGGGTDGELAKPLTVIQRVQIPPDQSRADRSVVSLAIHRATGGCRSVGNKEAGREDQPRNLYRREADVFALAEGSIWQRPLFARSGRLAGVSSPGHAPQGWPRNRRELCISPHTRRTASGNGSRGTCNQGSTGGSTDGCGSSLTTL